MTVVSTALIAVGTISLAHYFGDSVKIAGSIAIAGAALAISSCDVLRKRRRKVRLIISDTGQISLIRQGQQHFSDVGQADIVQMMPGSTLWSFFILLRLRQQNKKTTVVSFFLYSLSPQSFRRLSVACRWVAARNDAAQAHLQPNASPY